MKKFFAAFLLWLVLSVISVGFTAYAAKEDAYTYTIVDEKATITAYDKYSGARGELIIPDTLGGYPVVEIGKMAFYNNTRITSVVLPQYLERIDESAFAHSSLKSVTIPPSLKELENMVFQNCDITSVYIIDLETYCKIDYVGNVNGNGPLNSGKGKLYLNNELISTLIIPEGIQYIQTESFQGCDSISSVVLPKSLVAIESLAFNGCKGIKDVWFLGSEENKAAITIKSMNAPLENATWHYNSCPVGAPHKYSNDCDSSCNGCGATRNVPDHVYDNSCDKDCNVCKAERNIAHSYGEWTTNKKASCSESGEKSRKCIICSTPETTTIPPLQHDFSSEWTIDQKPSCTAAGSKSHHCQRCTATADITTISANGHNWGEWIIEKQPSVEEDGISARICSDCNLRETQTVAKLAADGHTHKFEAWKIVTAATCLKEGSAERYCSICNEKETKKILATGHQVGEWEEKAPTCTDDGYRKRICVICNEEEHQTIKATGHKFSDFSIIKEPTESSPGIKKGFCNKCGEEATEHIPAISQVGTDNEETAQSPPASAAPGSGTAMDFNWLWWAIPAAIGGIGIGIGAYSLAKKTKARK